MVINCLQNDAWHEFKNAIYEWNLELFCIEEYWSRNAEALWKTTENILSVIDTKGTSTKYCLRKNTYEKLFIKLCYLLNR